MKITNKQFEIIKKKYNLTNRELQVVKLIFDECVSNQEIADKMGIELRTAKVHVSHIYTKMNVSQKHMIVLEVLKNI